MVSFKENAPVKQTIVISAHTEENFRTSWEPLLIFSCKAVHTVEEKHSHNKHLHSNKALQNPNLEKIILKSKKNIILYSNQMTHPDAGSIIS